MVVRQRDVGAMPRKLVLTSFPGQTLPDLTSYWWQGDTFIDENYVQMTFTTLRVGQIMVSIRLNEMLIGPFDVEIICDSYSPSDSSILIQGGFLLMVKRILFGFI